jgi:hypothetical protein
MTDNLFTLLSDNSEQKICNLTDEILNAIERKIRKFYFSHANMTESEINEATFRAWCGIVFSKGIRYEFTVTGTLLTMEAIFVPTKQ